MIGEVIISVNKLSLYSVILTWEDHLKGLQFLKRE
jgi:hypothetical protein